MPSEWLFEGKDTIETLGRQSEQDCLPRRKFPGGGGGNRTRVPRRSDPHIYAHIRSFDFSLSSGSDRQDPGVPLVRFDLTP